MRLMLTGKERLVIEHDYDCGPVDADIVRLRVLYCGVCRTDAKMWAEGHRDLVLPRVPGHEIVGADDRGRRYAVWPGECCGLCRYCRSGRENLCPHIRIIGFHRHGGFADQVTVPQSSLFALPEQMDPLVASLAEPIGCVRHALKNSRLVKHQRVLVYGGGTMGLVTALMARESGAKPLVLEQDPEKINTAACFLNQVGIQCVRHTAEMDFDLVVNACSDPDAFSQGLARVAKGGVFCFFSGLTDGASIPAKGINLVHYREITVTGSYGLNRADMHGALCFMGSRQSLLKRLIAGVAGPEEAPGLMGRVLSGRGLKYVLDFSKS